MIHGTNKRQFHNDHLISLSAYLPIQNTYLGIWKVFKGFLSWLASAFMGGECRMAGVAVATPTLPVPQQHSALLSLLATPTLTCWLTILCFGHTNFGNHPPPMNALLVGNCYKINFSREKVSFSCYLLQTKEWLTIMPVHLGALTLDSDI